MSMTIRRSAGKQMYLPFPVVYTGNWFVYQRRGVAEIVHTFDNLEDAVEYVLSSEYHPLSSRRPEMIRDVLLSGREYSGQWAWRFSTGTKRG